MSKDILNRALEEVLRESYDELTGQDIPDHEFSEEFREKMEGLIREKDGGRKKKPVLRIIAAAAAVAAAAVICTVAVLGGGGSADRHGEYHGESITAETTSAAVSVTTVTSAAAGGTAVTDGASAVTTAKSAGTSAKTNLTSQGRKETRTTTAVAGRNTEAEATTTAREAVTQPPVVTSAVITPYKEERSVIMKKLTAFLAAVELLAPLMPGDAHAGSDRIKFSGNELYMFNEYESGHISPDINGDGSFDIGDVFELKLYSVHFADCFERYGYDQELYTDMRELYSDTAAKHIGKCYGTEDWYAFTPMGAEGANILAGYYLYKNGGYPTSDEIYDYMMSYTFLTEDGGAYVADFVKYISELKINTETYEERTYTPEELECFARFDSGAADIDINGDGGFDYFDGYDILAYYVMKNVYEDSAEKNTYGMSAELWRRIEEKGDVTLDGAIDREDWQVLIAYYYRNDPDNIVTDSMIGEHMNSMGGVIVSERNMQYAVMLYEDYTFKRTKTEGILLGDVNGDGSINAVDASAVLAYYTMISTDREGGFTDKQKAAADVDGNGSVNAVDASKIMAYYAYASTGGSMSIEEFLRQ